MTDADEPTLAEQRAAATKSRRLEWVAYLRAQLRGEVAPLELATDDEMLRRHTT